ncbi:MAG: YHYH protein, partial [Bacteroidetes bacterium]|nr:YHYH protein [Bacteroidota bacterium]
VAGSSRTATGNVSPITVTGLINGTTYSCSVTATNTVGTGSPSSSTNATPAAASAGTGTSTAAVACNYSTNVFNSSASVNAQSTSSWSCSSTNRNLTSNGIPDHSVGTFPNQGNPNTISVQSISVSYPIVPAQTGSVNTTLISLGHALNGIKFEPGTGGTCNDSGSNCSLNGSVGSWRIEAIGQTSFNFGVDFNNAHVQPTGEYHYHGMPERFIEKLGKGEQMTLVGWAADGFPVYAKYGYSTANSASSAIKILASSYRLKSTPTAGRPATTLYPMGTFTQDYEYVAGSGDLDECNGRTGVTPEFPNGIYYYVITTGYPYIQRCVKGSATAGGPPPR